jgi:hypothetical protein
MSGPARGPAKRRRKAASRPVAPPTAASLLEVAEKYIVAACVLIEHHATPEPIGFLASHGLELALKAFLLHSGVSVAELKRGYGHNLNELWLAAARRGLTVEFDLLWLAVLNHYYDYPYQYRYPQAGYATPLPAGEVFTRQLRQVLQAVATALNTRLMGYDA